VGAPVEVAGYRSACALRRTWLTCHWWPRDGKALAGRVSRCCREAAAPPGTPFLGNDPAWSFAPSSNPRRNDGSTDDRARLARPPIAIPSRTNWSVPVPPCHIAPGRCGSGLSRSWRPSDHCRFLGLIPLGGRSRAIGLATRRRRDRRRTAGVASDHHALMPCPVTCLPRPTWNHRELECRRCCLTAKMSGSSRPGSTHAGPRLRWRLQLVIARGAGKAVTDDDGSRATQLPSTIYS